jgi:transcription termination factor Rho
VSDNETESGNPAEKRARKPRTLSKARAEGESAGDTVVAEAPRTERGEVSPPQSQPAHQPQSQSPQQGERNEGGAPGQPQGDRPQGGGGNDNNQQRDGGDFQGRNRHRRDRFRDRPRGGGGGGGGGGNDRMPRDDGNDGGQQQPYTGPALPPDFPSYSLTDLKRMPAHKLLEMAETLQLHEGVARMRKQDVTFQLLKVLSRHPNGVAADGVLEILPDGYGFLRSADASYLAGPDDVYISPSQIRRFNLRTGDEVTGRIRSPKDGERYVALNVLDTLNGEPLEASKG